VLGYLGDDGVAEASKSVHPAGNPMSHSTHVGFNCPPTADDRGGEWFGLICAPVPDLSASASDRMACPSAPSPAGRPATLVRVRRSRRRPLTVRAICCNDIRTAAPGLGDWFEPYSVALGVGNPPPAVPAVRGADGCRWYAVPFEVIPDLGQVSGDDVKSSNKDCCDVLHDDVSGS
jgi:hypothetical protein